MLSFCLRVKNLEIIEVMNTLQEKSLVGVVPVVKSKEISRRKKKCKQGL
jgi:hypothetical protein